MAKRRFHEEYAGVDERRRMERQDGSMLNEDHNAMANMPQEVKMMYWPQNGNYMPEDLDDTIRGIDGQMGADNAGKKRELKPHKY